MHSGRTLLESILHVDDRGERLVVDLDGVECVGRGVLGVGDHDGDAVAHVADLVDRERVEGRHLDVVGDRPDTRDRAVEVAELLGAVRRHDVRAIQGRGDVDVGDLGVCHGAAQDRHVQGAGQLDVVGPVGLAVEESSVLLAAQGPADGRRGNVDGLGHLVPPIMLAANCTDLTMLW